MHFLALIFPWFSLILVLGENMLEQANKPDRDGREKSEQLKLKFYFSLIKATITKHAYHHKEEQNACK